jgi:hypothetical protein
MGKFLKIGALVLFLFACLIIALAPIGPMPGFFIGGTETKAPAKWGATAEVDEIRLMVPGSIPRVVIIWVVEYSGDLFVVGSSESGWVKMLGEGGKVKMRVAGNTYNLNADRVTSGWEPIVTAYANKYRPNYPEIVNNFPTVEEAEGSFGVFKLTR